jgi:thymidylate kinase
VFEKVLDKSYSEILFSGSLTPIIIDGLDGTGKETSSRLIGEELSSKGYNSLVVSYPQYKTYWGNVIRSFLREDGKNFDFSLEERMLVYAINRLESVSSIKNSVESNYSSNGEFIIFDRFITSNLITYSYFTKDNPKIDKTHLVEVYRYMNSIDSLFLSELRISNVKIIIPTINPTDSSELLKKDPKTDVKDSYEKIAVQKKAYEVYRFVSENIDKGKFKFISISDKEGMLSPSIVASKIISESVSKMIKKTIGQGKITILNLEGRILDKDVVTLISKLVDLYGTQRIKDLYKNSLLQD